MKAKNTHSIFKITAIALICVITAPAIVKFSHGFQNHKHEVCYGEFSSHLHEIDIDCEFYKFKLNSQYLFKPKHINLIEVEHITPKIVSQYNFISDYQKLQCSLRGPPFSV